jgi:hypothetical protein
MCPAGDLDLGLDAENRLEGVHEKRVVVGDQDANEWGSCGRPPDLEAARCPNVLDLKRCVLEPEALREHAL